MLNQKADFCLNIYDVIHEFDDIIIYFIWDVFAVTPIKE